MWTMFRIVSEICLGSLCKIDVDNGHGHSDSSLDHRGWVEGAALVSIASIILYRFFTNNITCNTYLVVLFHEIF